MPGLDASPIDVHPEVAAALAGGHPVVALESTILAHGLPAPDNRAVAADIEQVVRTAGAVPATIAVLDGRVLVGLTEPQLERICAGADIAKLSVRDLPAAVGLRRDGATTVASTSVVAHAAGIAVFATGGLGGVHREAATTFDESADLVTLARTPICVVSAGVKSILDVAATLERLESLSVSVVGYRTDRFPGFYLADSGHPLEWRVQSAAEIAAVLAARDRLPTPRHGRRRQPAAGGRAARPRGPRPGPRRRSRTDGATRRAWHGRHPGTA